VTTVDALANASLLLVRRLFVHCAATQIPQDAPVPSTAEQLQAGLYAMPALTFFVSMAVDWWRVV
jgi:hypothetical protein